MSFSDAPKKLKSEHCKQCWKRTSHCVCDLIAEPLSNACPVLILQHPQESQEPLGTARTLSLALENSIHRIGLSWRSLASALGPLQSMKDRNWVVLFSSGAKSHTEGRGHALKAGKGLKPNSPVEGIILLDGNWQQAKTLWWRNPWLKRLTQLSLWGESDSRYAALRKASRADALSTFEASQRALEISGEKSNILERLSVVRDQLTERLSTL